MNPSTETTPIADFILQSERNLRIAAAVHDEWEAVKDTLARGFCDRLEAVLKKEMPEWKFAHCGLLPERWGSFEFWKPKWEQQYRIVILASDYGAP